MGGGRSLIGGGRSGSDGGVGVAVGIVLGPVAPMLEREVVPRDAVDCRGALRFTGATTLPGIMDTGLDEGPPTRGDTVDPGPPSGLGRADAPALILRSEAAESDDCSPFDPGEGIGRGMAGGGRISASGGRTST